jgi:DNA-directed RNA polymerase subunit RPC12/RpoP
MTTPRDSSSPTNESGGAPAPSVAASGTKFPCKQCGARLEYVPGTTVLKCPYCGFENTIEQTGASVEELDFQSQLATLEGEADTHETLVLKCDKCAAEVTTPPDVTALACPYCGNNIVATALSKKKVKPEALLPFKVKQADARLAFRNWVKGLWFAPSKVRSLSQIDQGIVGLYVPFWTYDCDTSTAYTGARGDHYYTTETFTTTVNGKPTTQTRQVQHTRWTSASGIVADSFDDVLVLASQSLATTLARKLEPWDLNDLIPYRDDYLSGFRAESYQIGLVGGFDIAKTIMEPTIRETVRADIGGDEQRIDSMRVSYSDITFKHLLLPVWMSAYRYNNRVYRFLVNARTGEVQGDRPYSWIKITLAILAVLIVVTVITLIARHR